MLNVYFQGTDAQGNFVQHKVEAGTEGVDSARNGVIEYFQEMGVKMIRCFVVVK